MSDQTGHARNSRLLGLIAAPWVGFLAIALRPSPRQMWAQRWPTITFVGPYQIALERFVQIEGLENLPAMGPVILAGNHINKIGDHSTYSRQWRAGSGGGKSFQFKIRLGQPISPTRDYDGLTERVRQAVLKMGS